MEQIENEYDWHKVHAAGNGSLNFVAPGKLRTALVNDIKLCFVQRNGQLYAFPAKCPHAAGPLDEGHFNEKGDLVCPVHGFAFCIDTGQNTSGEGYSLPRLPVELRENGLFVGFVRPARRKRKGWWPFGGG
jgi:nitrite reductase/ring-hydroxylating ferredoxin subunit